MKHWESIVCLCILIMYIFFTEMCSSPSPSHSPAPKSPRYAITTYSPGSGIRYETQCDSFVMISANEIIFYDQGIRNVIKSDKSINTDSR